MNIGSNISERLNKNWYLLAQLLVKVDYMKTYLNCSNLTSIKQDKNNIQQFLIK